MEKLIKDSWFKLTLIILSFCIFIVLYNYYTMYAQQTLAIEQERCREYGEKAQKEWNKLAESWNKMAPSSASLDDDRQYNYSSKLKTCLLDTRVSLTKWDRTSRLTKVDDLYNDTVIFSCVTNDNNPAESDVFGEIKINTKGLKFGSNREFQYKTGEESKFWQKCSDEGNELYGTNHFVF